MKDNICPFSGLTKGRVPALAVLKHAIEENLKEVILLGIDNNNNVYYASSEKDERTLYQLEKFKKFLLDN